MSERFESACTIWLTGYSGAGKTTVGRHLVEHLGNTGTHARLLDADEVREGLNAGLGFSREDRAENVRRLGEVALLFAEAGVTTVVASISPYRADRARLRDRHEEKGVPFFEVHIVAPLELCEARDPKGLYRRARAGEVANFTGLSDAYEPPEQPDLVVDTAAEPAEAAALRILRRIRP